MVFCYCSPWHFVSSKSYFVTSIPLSFVQCIVTSSIFVLKILTAKFRVSILLFLMKGWGILLSISYSWVKNGVTLFFFKNNNTAKNKASAKMAERRSVKPIAVALFCKAPCTAKGLVKYWSHVSCSVPFFTVSFHIFLLSMTGKENRKWTNYKECSVTFSCLTKLASKMSTKVLCSYSFT